jgi:hypothetical protein
MNNITYTIINTSDLGSVNFSQVMETSIDTVRKNNDDSQVVLKYIGIEPSSLSGITKVNIDGRDFHNQTETLEIMSTTGTTGWATNSLI